MLLALYLGTICYAFISGKGKWFWLWCTGVLVLLVSTSSNYADLPGYTDTFNKIAAGSVSTGYGDLPATWYYLCLIVSKIGLNYRGMVIILIWLSMYLTHLFVKRMNCFSNAFWGMFMVFPALIQCIQLRFFLGVSIVVYALGFLLTDTRHGIIKYLIGVLVATAVHNSCIVFMILVAIYKFEKIHIFRALMYTTIGMVLLYISLQYLPPLAMRVFPSTRVLRYLVNSITKTSLLHCIRIIGLWLASVLFALLSCRVRGAGKERKLSRKLYRLEISRSAKALASVCIIGITLPLMEFDSNFQRFIEVGYVVCFVLFSRYWQRTPYYDMAKWIFLVSLAIVSMYAIYVYAPLNTTIIPLFSFDGFVNIFI